MTNVRQQAGATFMVTIAGRQLPDDVKSLMSYAFVEDNLNLPDAFYLSFHDPQHVVIAKTHAEVAAEVTVAVQSEVHPGGERIFKGEITALEAELEGGRTRTVLRGFDKANRLYRGRRIRAFKDVTYGDVVKQVAREAGLDVGRVEEPPGGPTAHVTQPNVTDAEFLTMLAGEVGFVLLMQEGKVSFYAAPESGAAPRPGTLDDRNPLQLIQGDNLLRFSAVVTSDSQVKDVEVRGWDIPAKRELIGRALAATSVAQVGTSPAALARAFGDRSCVSVDVPFGSQGQVDAAAKALAEQIAGTHAQFEGIARGNPKLRAGAAVSLGLAGEPFDGKYTLTVTRHVFDNGEYVTHFASTGRHERSLQALTSGGTSASVVSPAFVSAPIPGVVSAVVTDVKDEDGICQAKVKVPRYDDTFESGWLRVVQPGAGPDRGAIVLPEVNDEVLVAFEQGDSRRGYVLGGLYNGQDKPSPAAFDGAVGSDGLVARRSFTSRKGHYFLIDDTDGREHVEVATKGSRFSLKLAQDEGGGGVLVVSDGLVKVDAQGDITIAGKGRITVDATGELAMKGSKVTITADTDVQVNGLNVKLAGSASAEMTGARAKVAGSASLDLNGGATATLSGGLVKIN
ncbi:VgrG-related protein [Motilibacter deserti]|uniref:VgrG-related protein n=1 Tax=Motilibacter deserti TaxID=2714956 RepID=A0ABX0GSF9_9ACTN|nr:VgrG-related protein [Motilibacter deserti]NHC13804.1 VgrG-related protein [Motilibacter deserti]